MNQISVEEAAAVLGVSPQRVRAMLRNDQLAGRRISGRWLIDPASMSARKRRAGQPFSPRVAWSLADIAAGRHPPEVSSSEASRLKARWRNIANASDPVSVLGAVMARRAKASRWSAPDPVALLDDPRIVAAGKSDPRAGIRSPNSVDVYVRRAEFDGVVADHLLVPAAESANAVLRVAERPLVTPLPWLIIAADLADGDAREMQQAERLIREMGSRE